MPAPAFGFSVGDFVAGIKLVKDLIDSLDEAAGAGPVYRRLIAELRSLERALNEVNNLRVHTSQACQKVALEQAASQCQDCIETFLRENNKFQATLSVQSTASRWRANLHKFQWAVCKQDAVCKFRAEIAGHVLTINTLLATIQLASTTLQAETAQAQYDAAKQRHQEGNETRSLVKRNNELLNTQADLILTISRTIATCATQQETQDLQSIMLKVLSTNIKIYEIVLDMQKAVPTQIPPQIDRQQPIFFEDAHGRVAPFHIEFINSLEAFQAVMEVRFRHVPGLKKIKRNEYLIQEHGSRRKLNLQAPWESVFLPGRKVVMSMIFQTPQTSMSSCPGCQTENEAPTNESQNEVQCLNPDCRIWYQRISEVDENPDTPSPRRGKQCRSDGMNRRVKRARRSYEEDMSDDSDDEDPVHHFRRVQIIHKRQRKLPNSPTRVFAFSHYHPAVSRSTNPPPHGYIPPLGSFQAPPRPHSYVPPPLGNFPAPLPPPLNISSQPRLNIPQYLRTSTLLASTIPPPPPPPFTQPPRTFTSQAALPPVYSPLHQAAIPSQNSSYDQPASSGAPQEQSSEHPTEVGQRPRRPYRSYHAPGTQFRTYRSQGTG
ncbi:hypothetical protein yc1106_08992 [Curvularia clavata]|uniref:Ubiquitin-like domain-containing protein n=1 Tax=Curvularia clavata TaxID=95742 RepID=A0A9Q8ZJA0_CURCL|nr:hypothetical protein yc1106_08992 [Curvularia clavata]